MYIKYLTKGPNRSNNDVVEYLYPNKDKFIVHNMNNNGYLVFDTPAQFKFFMESLSPEERTFEEVIYGDRKQRIKFDIDIEIDKLNLYIKDNDIKNTQEETVSMILNETINAILEEFIEIYTCGFLKANIPIDKLNLTNEDILITSSSSHEKYSFHLYLAPKKFCVPNSNDAHILTKFIIKAVSHKFIDAGVNKSIQNLRITGNHKPNNKRVKEIIGAGEWLDTIVSYFDDEVEVLPPLDPNGDVIIKPNSIPLDNIIAEEALKIAAPYIKNFTVRKIENNNILLNRLKPTNCIFCNRIHDNDNTLYININSPKVYLACWRQPPNRKLEIGQIYAQHNQKADYISWVIERIKNNLVQPTEELSIKNKIIYNEPHLRPFNLTSKTLIVHAPMKIGKTKEVIKTLETYDSSARILIISFRQTFSMFLIRALKEFDFQLYSDIQGPLNKPRMIVQVESLHRLAINQKFDLIILDEIESIFSQFDSGLIKRLPVVLTNFEWLMETAKNILAMDANITDRTIRLLTHFAGEDILYHRNLYKNAQNDTWFATTKKADWLAKLFDALNNKESIFIPTNSIDEANTLYDLIIKNFPDIKITKYTSKTSVAEKKLHFSNVDIHWNDKDVVIITPTCTAGVSFERRHFDKVFPYFTDRSCDVETCRQMVARVRDVSSGEYYVFFDCLVGGQYLTNITQLKEYICSIDNVLFDDSQPNTLEGLITIKLSGDGQRYIKEENSAFKLWVENKRIENLSRNKFIERFLYQLTETGANINILEQPTEDLQLLINYKECKKICRENQIMEVVNAPILTEQEAEEIKYAISMYNQGIISADEMPSQDQAIAVHKHELLKLYQQPLTSRITKEFVQKYDNRSQKDIFINNQRVGLFKYGTLSEILEKIKMEERGKGSVQNSAESGKTYIKHAIALTILMDCGFTDLRNFIWMPGDILKNNLLNMDSNIKKLYPDISNEFHFKPILPGIEDPNYMDYMLKVINKIIGIQYGIKINKVDKKKCFEVFYEVQLYSLPKI